MPHAMTEAFTVEETPTGAPATTPTIATVRASARQQESETPNERAMRTATAARTKSQPAKRPHG